MSLHSEVDKIVQFFEDHLSKIDWSTLSENDTIPDGGDGYIKMIRGYAD